MVSSFKMVQITNVVVHTDLHTAIDLTQLNDQDIRYDPETFSGAIWKHREIGGCCLVFRNGKLNCSGNRSVQEAKKRIKQYAGLLHQSPSKIEVITMSAVHQLSTELDYRRTLELLGATYEPEIHNAVMLKRGKIHYNCFRTGKVIIMGIRDIDDIYPTLLELELCTI